jgi:CshA-type fibril repeat protein
LRTPRTTFKATCPPITRIGGVGLVAALLAAGAVIATPQAASAAEPFTTSALFATVASSSNIVSVNRTTGATTTVLTAPGGATGLNQIGISGDGNTMFLTNGTNVYEYTASTETWAVTPRGTTTVANTMGGVDPKTGNYFYGGQASGDQFTFASYNPTTNAISTSTVRVTAAGAPGGNGDLAFDGQGNLFFVASSTAGAQVYRVDADQLAGGTTTATTVGPAIASTIALNSMAFGQDGYLYIAGSGTNGFLQVNPITGAINSRQTLDASITDLGSNALPSTGSVAVDLPDGRFKPADQFTVTLGGGGVTTGNTTTTTGTETSAQVGPLLLLPGGTYTVTQTPTPGTNPADYTTTWVCTDPATGTTVANGTGNNGSFTIPEGVSAVNCVFTNTVIPAPVATPDTSKDNTPGTPVTVTVVGNDSGDVDPTTVRLVNGGGTPVTELTVPGEGTWTVDPATGKISFTPAEDFTGNPTPVTYTVNDERGHATTSTVTVTYKPTAANDSSTGNTPSTPVTVTPSSNDSTNVDPTTVRLVNGAGDPVTTLTVDGEGTWTVATTTGKVTFTPADGFTGNPTPVTYTENDGAGNTVTAKITVTYLPTAADDSSLNNTQGDAVTVNVVGNDSTNTDPATVRLVISAGEPVEKLTVPGEGTWTVDTATGKVTFTPADGFTGNPTPVKYTAEDTAGNVTTADVVVTYRPVATNDSSTGNKLGTAVTVTPSSNDSDNVDPTSARLVNGAGAPVTTLTVDGEGAWSVDTATGKVTFTPADGFTGNPTPVTYTETDGAGNAVTAKITVTYLPSAADDSSLNNTPGDAVTVNVVGNDSTNIDPTSVRLINGAGDPVEKLTVNGEGVWTVDPATGKITFTPEGGFTGNPTAVTYTAEDTAGNATTANVVVTYKPTAANDSSTGNTLGTAVTVTPASNDSANVDPTSVRLVNSGGDALTELTVDGEGKWTVDPDTGEVTFTPADGFTGNPTSVTYTETDGAGNTVTAKITVTYDPVAMNDRSTGNTLGTPVTVTPTGNDSSNVDPTSVRLIDGNDDPVTTLTVDGEGVWTVNPATGKITFTPEDGFTGDPTPMHYVVADAAGTTATATVTIAYTPVATNDTSSGNTAGKPVTVDVVGNDSANLDPTSVRLIDGSGDPVTRLVAGGEGIWTVDPVTGAITFTPEMGFTGNPTPIEYTATDALGNAVTATLTVTYLPLTPTPAPTPTASPMPTASPAAAPAPAKPSGDELAFTGADVLWPSIGGIAALILGAALMLFRRRRGQQN